MNRNKKALLTSIASMLHQVVAIICGFILPRFFLMNYGSAVNGLISSITQFLGFISLAECGIGAVVQSALYGPLAKKDEKEISRIFKSSSKFFNRVGIILLIYTIILALIYPVIVLDSFDCIYTASLILIISISTFSQYYIGVNYRLILGADQYGFVSQGLSCIVLVLNTAISIFLIYIDCSVHTVKLVSSLLFLVKPLIMQCYAKRKYNIDKEIVLTEEPIKQKWNGLSQHFATVVNANTDSMVLTLLSTLDNVSVYSVYHMIVSGVKNLVNAFTAGNIALFGNMIAKEEKEELNHSFCYFEWIIHTITTIVFSLTLILSVPFVKVYTTGVTDVNYIVPEFAAWITIANAVYCFRLPYNILVMAAGHYKQTQTSAIVEAILNIIISIAFVYKRGLVGVAIGTFVAMLYRTCYLAWYLSKNIIFRHIKYFVLHCSVDIISAIVIVLVTNVIDKVVSNYGEWIFLALECGCIAVVISGGINYLCYRKEVVTFINKIVKREKNN